MKKTLLHRGIFVSLVLLGLSFATQVSARTFSSGNSGYRMVNINGFGVSGVLIAPAFAPASPILRDGGDDDGDHGPGGPRDTNDNDDTLRGGDTTHHRGGGPDNDGDGDTTRLGGGDTTGGGCHGHGGDTTGLGDTTIFNDSTFFGHRGHDDDDTVECGGHHHGDTTVVTDTNTHILFGGSNPQSIVVKSQGSQANVSIVFTNNLTTSVKITNMALTSGRYFTITSGAPTTKSPVTLKAGASITLKVSFNAADQTLHSDQIVVTSNSTLSANTISLKGQVAAAASVSTSLPAGVTITSYPNPVTSYLKVDLTGVNSAAAVIYDMQGKQVLAQSLSSNEWIWNGTAADGSALPAGTYIVRISGASTEGAAYVSTQKIVLAR
jgi:hypothetical protein